MVFIKGVIIITDLMKPKISLGIDIGGSHITCALIDLEKNSIITQSKVRMDVDSGGNSVEIIDRWLEAINKSVSFGKHEFPEKIGVSIPGPFHYDSGICLMKNQNKYESLYGVNIKEIIAEKLNIKCTDIRFSNDAACFLWGEVLSGVARNAAHVIGITLGTGLGSARFSNGFVEDANLWNSKFKSGIAEDYLSTRWFIKRYFELSGATVANVKSLIYDVESGKSLALDVFKEFGRNLGMFLSQFFQNEKELEVVVLGGNIAKAYSLFGKDTEQYLQENGVNLELRQAELGEEAALIGAAGEWKSHSAEF
jgi:glucokinase